MAKLQVAENIRRFADQYKVFVEAADQLEAIGSLEQATQEAVAQAEKAKADLAELKSETVKAKAALKKVADSVDAQTVEAKAKAEQDVKDAKALADKLVADANEQALTILNSAKDEAQKIEYKCAEFASSASQALELAKQELVEVEAKRTKAQADLNAINKQADALKAKLNALIG